MSMLRRVALVAALPMCFACIRSAGGSGPGTDLNLLTRAQIREVGVTTAYEVVDRLKPLWLTVRGGPRSFGLETEIVVFQDDMYLGGTDALRRIGIDGIYTIRYLDGATASATLPGMQSRHVDGAIIVSMHPPDPGDTSSF
ncbi:hypothetical protein ACFL3B_00725 [Gemmatimonadota bacterium]